MFEVFSSNGVSRLDRVDSKNEALMLLTDLMKLGYREVGVYKVTGDFHSTTQIENVVMFAGDGSYLDNVSKRDPKLLAKKVIVK